MNILCIYHADCLDGLTAAWIVRQTYPNVLFHSAKYGDLPPLILMDKETKVIIVDFSYPQKEMESIESIVDSVHLLDHHESAIRKLDKWKQALYTTTILDTTKSGAILTWEWFNEGKPIPAWIQAVGDRDIWEFEHPYTREICEYIYSKPLTLEWLDEIHNTSVEELIIKGKILWKPKMDRWLKRIKDDAYRTQICGYDVPIINVHYTEGVSEILNIMAEGEPFAVGYYYSKEHIVYSFRSKKDQPQSINVAELAEKLGGGGHKHAAGWKVNRI
mgnify:CR=1 FL=1